MSKLYILSRDEFDALPEDIKIPTDKSGRPDWTWLRSEFISDKVDNHRWADAAMKIGNTIYYGNIIVHRGCGVRPLVRINDDLDPDMKIGDHVVFGTDLDGDPLEWICINDRVLMTKHTLFYSDFDEKSNKYSESKLKSKLDEIVSKIFDDFGLKYIVDTDY